MWSLTNNEQVFVRPTESVTILLGTLATIIVVKQICRRMHLQKNVVITKNLIQNLKL